MKEIEMLEGLKLQEMYLMKMITAFWIWRESW